MIYQKQIIKLYQSYEGYHYYDEKPKHIIMGNITEDMLDRYSRNYNHYREHLDHENKVTEHHFMKY